MAGWKALKVFTSPLAGESRESFTSPLAGEVGGEAAGWGRAVA